MCVATVRGALEKLPGIGDVAIEQDQKPFKVEFDKTKIDVDKILAALEAAGEPAKKL